MRTMQQKILKQADRLELLPEEMKILEREDLEIPVLRKLFSKFITRSRKGQMTEIETACYISNLSDAVSFLSSMNVPADKKKSVCNILLVYGCLGSANGTGCIPKPGACRHLTRGYVYLSSICPKYAYQLLQLYADMKSNGYGCWHTAFLIRLFRDLVIRSESGMTIYTSEYMARSIGCLAGNHSIGYDFRYNREESLLYRILDDEHFRYQAAPALFKACTWTYCFDKFYDKDKHCFIFPTQDVKLLFTDSTCRDFDTRRMKDMAFACVPHILAVRAFCVEQMHLEPDSPNETEYYHMFKLCEAGMEQSLLDASLLLHNNFTAEMPCFSMYVVIHDTRYINITLRIYRRVHVSNGNTETKFSPSGKPYFERELAITPDGTILCKINKRNGHFVPATAKQVFFHTQGTLAYHELMRTIIRTLGEKDRFLIDVMEDCWDAEGCMYNSILPISLSECRGYHNRNEFILAKFPEAENIHIKWNKINLNLSYLILKSMNYVMEGHSMQILLNQRNTGILKQVSGESRWKECVIRFLSAIITNKIHDSANKRTGQKPDTGTYEHLPFQEDELASISEIGRTAYDYVEMCMNRRYRYKVRLDIYDFHHLRNLHDNYSHDEEFFKDNTKKVAVPKDTRFRDLRKILPPQFEWIRTRKRLIHEAVIMHHCVWSYADKISQDKCAIYSFYDETGTYAEDGSAKRYTIEFSCSKKDASFHYHVVQIQGKYDKVNTSLLTYHIYEILEKAGALG